MKPLTIHIIILGRKPPINGVLAIALTSIDFISELHFHFPQFPEIRGSLPVNQKHQVKEDVLSQLWAMQPADLLS